MIGLGRNYHFSPSIGTHDLLKSKLFSWPYVVSCQIKNWPSDNTLMVWTRGPLVI